MEESKYHAKVTASPKIVRPDEVLGLLIEITQGEKAFEPFFMAFHDIDLHKFRWCHQSLHGTSKRLSAHGVESEICVSR